MNIKILKIKLKHIVRALPAPQVRVDCISDYIVVRILSALYPRVRYRLNASFNTERELRPK